MPYTAVPWKRNIAKVPQRILKKVKDLDSDLVRIAATKKVSMQEVEAGIYR